MDFENKLLETRMFLLKHRIDMINKIMRLFIKKDNYKLQKNINY